MVKVELKRWGNSTSLSPSLPFPIPPPPLRSRSGERCNLSAGCGAEPQKIELCAF